MRTTTWLGLTLAIGAQVCCARFVIAQVTRPATAPATQPLVHDWDSREPNVRSLPLSAYDIAFSGDDKCMGIAAADAVFQLDLASGRELWRTDVGKYTYGRRLAFSPDGTRLAVSHATGVAILDAATGAILRTLTRENPAHDRNPKIAQFHGMTPVAFSPDGKTVAAASILVPRGEIYFWETESGKWLRTLTVEAIGSHNVFDIAFSPDGKRIASVDGSYSQSKARDQGGQLRVWDLDSGTILRTCDGAIYCSWAVGFSPDGKMIATGSGLFGRHDSPGGEVHVWEVESGRTVYSARRRHCVYRVRFSPDGKRLVSAGGDRTRGDAELTVTNTSTWADELLAGNMGAIQGLSFSHDGRILASASPLGHGNALRLWNLPPSVSPAEAKGDIPSLIRQLADDDVRVRQAAVRQLRALGKTARPALLEARNSNDLEVRTRVEEILNSMPGYASVVVHTAGLAAYWRFSGPSPTQSLVGGYTGSFVNAALNCPLGGAPASDESSKKALWLDGDNSGFLTTLASQETFREGASFMCWICFDTTPAKAGRIFSIMAKGEPGKELDLQAEPDGKIHYHTGAGESTSFTPASLEGWHHLVATVDLLSKRRCVYWDGKAAAEDLKIPAHSPSTCRFTIGYSSAFPGRSFQGAIDEVALFNRALSPQEVQGIYSASRAGENRER